MRVSAAGLPVFIFYILPDKRLENSQRKGKLKHCASSRMVTLHSIPEVIQGITQTFS